MLCNNKQQQQHVSTKHSVNLQLALRWRYAYRLRHYVVVTRVYFGSSSYDSVMMTHWPCITDFVVYPPTGLMALTGR